MKKKILTVTTYVTAILFVLSACAVDSESDLPLIICGICILYWALFAYANRWFEKGGKK